MNMVENNSSYSQGLREMLLLRYEPIAIKLISDEKDIPADAIHPMRDLNKHMALCQAFAMTRRNKKTIYMDKTSEWCWNPLIGFGFVDGQPGSKAFDVVCKNLGIADEKAAKEFFAEFPTLPKGSYIGIVTAPLSNCTFKPDIVLIYCNNAQLRSLLWAIKNVTGKIVNTNMDAIDSCVYACIPTIKTGEYRVTIPDVGEYERASADENEIILSVPGEKIEELLQGLHSFYDRGMGYAQLSKEMQLDFTRPPFYNELFDIWGLDQGENWTR